MPLEGHIVRNVKVSRSFNQQQKYTQRLTTILFLSSEFDKFSAYFHIYTEIYIELRKDENEL